MSVPVETARLVDHLATEIGRRAVGCITQGGGWVCLADLCQRLREVSLEAFDQRHIPAPTQGGQSS